jgi:1-acyl-sn-glycerol-3-phosphate acyltransferase
MISLVKKIILSILIWTVGSILTIALYFAMLLCTALLYPFDKKRTFTHMQCFWWSDAVITLNPYWKLEISGLNNIDKQRTYIKMQFKWVAKESLFKIPFVGWSMALAKHIKLQRGKLGSIKKVYREANYWLRSGISILFFPEGTRSETTEMGDFRNGAFKLAIKERVSILPIKFQGTGTAIPRGSWIFTTKTYAKLKILPPIETTDYQPADFVKLKDLARSILEKGS